MGAFIVSEDADYADNTFFFFYIIIGVLCKDSEDVDYKNDIHFEI